MPFAASKTNFMRRVDIQRANRQLGFGLLALDVADPNTGGVTPTANLLAMGTDASLWKANGTTWTLVSGGSGTGSYPDDVPCVFGSNAADYNNFKVELDTSGSRMLLISPVGAYTGATTGGSLPQLNLQGVATAVTTAATGQTGGAVVVTGGFTLATVAGSTGGAGGAVLIESGFTDASAVGATGGNSGALTLRSGAATSSAGTTSGSSGNVTVQSGNSADADSGNLTLAAGTGANTGDVLVTIPAGTTTTGEHVITVGTSAARYTAAGFLPPAYAGVTAQTLGAVAQLLYFNVTAAGTQTVTMGFAGTVVYAWIVKTGGNGLAGDTLDVQTTTGSIFPSAIPFTGDANGKVTAALVFNTTVANRAFTAGQSVSVIAVEGGGSVDCEVYLVVLRTS